MAAHFSILCLLLCFSFVRLGTAQRCEPYGLDFGSSAACVGRMQYSIYVPGNLTQSQAYKAVFDAAFANQAISGTGISTGLASVPPLCATAVVALICGVFVPGKGLDVLLNFLSKLFDLPYVFAIGCANTSIPFPSPLCLSICTNVTLCLPNLLINANIFVGC